MGNFIKYVNIRNFKSVVDLRLKDCRRINLFIGYPNVGKSNVLEALGLFSVPFLNEGESLNKLVRVENKNELLYNSVEESCSITTNLKDIELQLIPDFYISHGNDDSGTYYYFSDENKLSDKSPYASLEKKEFNLQDESHVKRYIFNPNNKWKTNNKAQLLPPFGENIIDILSYNSDISKVKAWIKQEFTKYGLEYVLDKSSNSLKVQRRLGGDEVMQLPYSSIADT